MARRRSDEQPVLAPSGGKHGARKQLEAQQEGAPLPRTRGPGGGMIAPAGGQQGGGGQPAPLQRPDIFGPTQRPDEPVTAGTGPGEMGMLPEDPAEFLRAVYLRFPSPGVRKLLERAAQQTRRRPASESPPPRRNGAPGTPPTSGPAAPPAPPPTEGPPAGPPPMGPEGGPGGEPPLSEPMPQ